ncbi:MAG TPA: L,D-transpeptidase family protein [Sphingomonas sp.]|jgi:lipoprotein-anchoring transpeptidase ErfK/SrfK|uniref:L,D-transpeptidase family protein n=1 Tax=Sphingomonas sp. TaxID=28214 RepID=UPI002ED95C02
MAKLLNLAIGTMLALGAAPAFASDEMASDEVAVAVEAAAATLAPNRFVWSDPGTAEPVTVVISVPLQRAFVYRGEALVAATAVSTGTDDKPTPTGIYPILQKAEKHRSNLYDASMPYMQRLTWDGIALHAGANPGFPASHGCIRLPTAFAKKLFEVTTLGTNVVVTDDVLMEARLNPELLRTDAMRANEAQFASLGD